MENARFSRARNALGVALRSGWNAWNGMLVAEWLECAWSGWNAWNGMLVAGWLECLEWRRGVGLLGMRGARGMHAAEWLVWSAGAGGPPGGNDSKQTAMRQTQHRRIFA